MLTAAIALRILYCDDPGGAVVVGRRAGAIEELLPTVAPTKSRLADASSSTAPTAARTSSPPAVTVEVVDLLEVVEVEHERGQRRERPRGLGDHPLDRVLRRRGLLGSPVSASVAARSSAIARLRRLASTGPPGVTDSSDRAACASSPSGSAWLDEDRADHLAADQQRLARRHAGAPAQLARQERVLGSPLLVACGRSARPGRSAAGALERSARRRVGRERGRGLEAIGAVVAVEHGDRAVGDRALEVLASGGRGPPVRPRSAAGSRRSSSCVLIVVNLGSVVVGVDFVSACGRVGRAHGRRRDSSRRVKSCCA